VWVVSAVVVVFEVSIGFSFAQGVRAWDSWWCGTSDLHDFEGVGNYKKMNIQVRNLVYEIELYIFARSVISFNRKKFENTFSIKIYRKLNLPAKRAQIIAIFIFDDFLFTEATLMFKVMMN